MNQATIGLLPGRTHASAAITKKDEVREEVEAPEVNMEAENLQTS